MTTYKRGGVSKHSMSGYKFKQVGNSRGPVMASTTDTGKGKYGQGGAKKPKRDSSVHSSG